MAVFAHSTGKLLITSVKNEPPNRVAQQDLMTYHEIHPWKNTRQFH